MLWTALHIQEIYFLSRWHRKIASADRLLSHFYDLPEGSTFEESHRKTASGWRLWTANQMAHRCHSTLSKNTFKQTKWLPVIIPVYDLRKNAFGPKDPKQLEHQIA